MLITVRYTGPGEAILAGTYIQQDETRSVTPAQLQAAQEAHPAGFVIVAGDDAPELQEPAQPDPQENDQVDLNEPAEALADAVDLSEPAEAPAVELNEPATPAPARRRQNQRQQGGA